VVVVLTISSGHSAEYLLGAVAAGRTVMRAVRKTEDYETEVEMEDAPEMARRA